MTAAHGPINEAPWTRPQSWETELRAALTGIELGAYDERILAWATEILDTPTLTVLVSWLHRVRAAQPLQAADTVTITRAEFTRLTEADEELGALHAAGVDNWEGYDEAMRP